MEAKIPFNNSNMFSNHYLQNRIKNDLEEWKHNDTVKKIFDKIKEEYNDKKQLFINYNESQLEDNFIKKVLQLLGQFFEVQEKTDVSSRTPDYAFFPSEETKREAVKNKGKKEFYKFAIAVGDAKKWNLSLDKKAKGENTFEFQNPSFQIDTYLRETELKWGILTNGKKWRVYFQDTSYKLDSFYEVDLEEIINNDDLESFKYFYFFFRIEAFIKDSTGKTFLNNIFHESIRYAESIGENLEENIYKSLKWMAEGFLSVKSNQLSSDEKTLKEIHKNSLIFLYRLLFALYANSRGLLKPPKGKGYDRYDINFLIEEILDKLDKNEVSHGAWYWTNLEEIFILINSGSVGRGIPKNEFFVPSYNGGLFDPENYPFLKNKKINDKHIAKVIDLLVRTKSKDSRGYGRIDYSDLSLRHLGGIYEGLLEYKLKVAEEDIVAVSEKGKLIWLPKSEIKNKRPYEEIKKGEVYLVTDKGERKATGSYYTPDYIVKYIVENTLGPLIEEKIKDLKNNDEIKEAILSIKVLDPAMGSGHFLVEATDFLASKIVEYIGSEKNEENDIDLARREVVKRCIYGVDINPLATELAKVSLWLNTIKEDKPLSFLDHHLKTGNSLIGADIAILDHYPNNSIKNGKDKMQKTLHDFKGINIRENILQLLQMYKKIMQINDDTISNVEEKEKIFHDFQQHKFRMRFIELANIYTSIYFGNEVSNKDYNEILEYFPPGSEKKWDDLRDKDWFKKSQEIAEQNKFFHWKLEFPEIFFEIGEKLANEKENAGFDAIIGNPPYFDIEKKLSEFEKEFLKNNYQVYTGANDMCYFFYEKSFNLLCNKGIFGMITSRYFQEARYGNKLREFLSQFKINEIIDFGSNVKVFRSSSGEEVTIHTVIYLGQKEKPKSSFDVVKFRDWPTEKNDIKGLIQFIQNIGEYEKIEYKYMKFEVESSNLNKEKWVIEPKIFLNIISKLEKAELNLGDEETSKEFICFVGQSIQSGLDTIETKVGKTGVFRVNDNEIKELNLEKEILLPLIKTSHLRRYLIKDNDEYLIYLTPETNIDDYPNTKKHLQRFKKELESRYDIKNSSSPWYSIANLRNKDLFEKKTYKLLWPMVSPHNRFAIQPPTRKMAFTGDVYYAVPKEDFKDSSNDIYYICGLVNSKLLEFYHQKNSKATNWGYSYGAGYVSSYPIPRFSSNKNLSEKIKLLTHEISTNRYKCYEEIKNFLKWISREWDMSIEDASSKNIIKNYWKYNFNEMVEFSRANKSKIKASTSSREFQETFEREWKKSTDIVVPLTKIIQNAQNELDAVVFKHYRLTENEVKIVLKSLGISKSKKDDILKKFKEIE
jgi:hypothetical protein